MKLPVQRSGERLKVNKKLVTFSFWPTKMGAKGNASLQTLLFSQDPWALIDLTIKSSCPANSKKEALACMAQARDFYEGVLHTQRIAARPLNLYYCFMNLVKAFCLTRNTRQTFDKAQHGLSEKLRAPNRELADAFLQAFPSPNHAGIPQNFSEFMHALTGSGLAAAKDFDIPVLLPQILPGHRLWSFAAGKKERFLAVHDMLPFFERATQRLWLNIYVVSEDLTRIGITYQDFLSQSGLSNAFAQVSCDEKDRLGRSLLCFQMKNPLASPNTKYANVLHELYQQVYNLMWVTVTTIPPYRRFYVYLRPPAEAPYVIHQLLSVYAVAYYLGSITRYRPHHFPAITDKPFGPQIQDFVNGQPQQFLYLIASEFAKRDIAMPPIL